VLVMLDLH
jgi:hypothetical protein